MNKWEAKCYLIGESQVLYISSVSGDYFAADSNGVYIEARSYAESNLYVFLSIMF